MIKLGDLDFTNIKQGSTDIIAVYLADKLIWGGSQPTVSGGVVTLTLTGGTTSSVTYSDGIIPNSAFTNNLDIVGVEIGSSITRVNSNAFAQCSNISSVTIGDSVTRLGGYAFSGCTALTEVVIPDSVTEFGGGVFNYCSGLTSVTIGSGFTTFSNPQAFAACSSLSSITINATTAPTLYANTFIAVPSVGTLYVPYGSDYSSWIGTGATSTTQLASGWTIQYINAPSVGGDVILHLTGGTTSSVTFSSGTVPNATFAQRQDIVEVEVGDGITTLGNGAFADCSGLTSITMASSVTTLGDAVFENDVTLSSLSFYATTPPTRGSGVFYDLPQDYAIYVPSGSVEAYKTAWSGSASHIQAME